MKIGFAVAAVTVCASTLVLAQAPKTAPGATPAGFEGSAYVKARDIPARIITFSVEPASIRAGQPSMLVWHTENPTSVTIDPEPGRVTPRGSRRLTPAATTTYTLTVRGPNDQMLTKTVTVTVAGTVPAASVGRGEAATLVADTVAFNDKTELQSFSHTESLHMVKKFTRSTLDTLNYELTIEDPNVFEKPYAITRAFSLRPDLKRIDEFICENNRDYRPLFG